MEEEKLTLYELNQSAYESLPDYTEKDLQFSLDLIEYFLDNYYSNETEEKNYWMLLNNESKYYTIFNKKTKISTTRKLALELIDVVSNLGKVKSIEITPDWTAIEIWIMYNGNCKAFYFFNYTQGVIEL